MATISDRWLRSQLNKNRDKIEEKNHNGVLVRISRTGVIAFYFRYRLDGKQHRYGLGTYPHFSLAEAVNKRSEILKLIEQGIDPKTQKEIDKTQRSNSMYFGYLFAEWYREHQDKGRANDFARKRAVENHIFPVFENIPVGQITYTMMYDHLEALAKKVPAQTKDVISVLKKFWRYLLRKAYVNYPSIFESISSKEMGAVANKGKRILSPEDLRYAWKAFERPTWISPLNRGVSKICLLTGCRYGEFQSSGSFEYDRDSATWTKKRHKTVDKTEIPIIRPLAPIAQEVFENCIEFVGDSNSFWEKKNITENKREYSSLSDICIQHVKFIRKRLNFDIESFSLHDLRRTCRTYMEALSEFGLVNPKVPKLALGHVTNGVESVYNLWQYSDSIRSGYAVYERFVTHILESKENNLRVLLQTFAQQEKQKDQVINMNEIKQLKIVDSL